ncbi:putative plk plk-unclassified protein kinase [Diplodia seriata]|uniref:Putative plk plk-unclassified protein kinase n=1 Tax=Diplodia seriata TaxID=420778 RepID=A0A0G2DPW7_9PEZI|nr:putative plk plk-unclassified protein kinase [Diplodia seriata]
MSVHADPPPSLVREPHRFEYETAEQLGKGGFAICHRAALLDNGKPTGRMVALKIVKSKMEPPKLAQKFVTELQIHSKLHHPNIVDFYRAFSFETSTYVVLEICDNGSLADILKKRRHFTMPEIRRFLIQTCGAVKYLHHRNIIHRDLKTGNLFLDKDMNVKVGDFGLAAVLISQNDLGARRTTMCGTPNYLAPEILEKGGKGHNEKVDLWAIGIIAYTLAVGKAPFHAPKREDIYKKLQTRDYSWPDAAKTTNDICLELKDLVGSLLVHEDDRPSPDEIVSHDFFKLGYIPARLDAKYKAGAPKWPTRSLTASARARGYSDEWFKLCKESGVGEVAEGKVFSVIGGRKIRSVVKDCEKELALGRQPVVPIPSDTVYVPYPDRNDWPDVNPCALAEIVEDKESSQEGGHLAEITGNDRAQSALMKPPTRGGRTFSHKENVAPQPLQTGEKLERPKRTRSVQAAIRTALGKEPSSVDKVPLEYYTDCGEKGLRSTEVAKERRRTTGILWAKFGKYMCQQGPSQGDEMQSEDDKVAVFVRFYQRFGSVGIWGFGDGSFQFNFPDHTKLVLSADGCFCNFTCLSLEAAQYLEQFGEVPYKYIKTRNTLTTSLRTLLNATGEKGAPIKALAEANYLKEKLQFIMTVIDGWVAGGGLGCSTRATARLRWEGPLVEDERKQEWVTVGRAGGDAPRGSA